MRGAGPPPDPAQHLAGPPGGERPRPANGAGVGRTGGAGSQLTGRPGTGSDLTAEALAPLRARIDGIDHEIVALLNERAQIALEIGRIKQVTGRRSVRDAAREAQVLERVTSASAGLFPEPELVALYRKLIAATRRVQHAQKREGRPGAVGGVDDGPRDAVKKAPRRR